MKIYFYALCYFIFSQLCTSIHHTQHIPKLCTTIQRTPKLCIHCKFYVNSFFNRNEFAKCSLFVLKKDLDTNFIIGKNENNTEYNYCSIARKYDYMCGEEGKYYSSKH
jgi:hypothetical protein